ncbi:Uncharacterised protein [Mycobacterium tuberculosis]|nr:Uncharacterised protein [Mycobacterium tuberculosis]
MGPNSICSVVLITTSLGATMLASLPCISART